MVNRWQWRGAAVACIASIVCVGFGVLPARAQDDDQDSSGSGSVDIQIGKLSDQMVALEKEFSDLPLAAEARCRETFTGQVLDGALASGKAVNFGVMKKLILGRTCHALLMGNMDACSDASNLGASADATTDPAARRRSPATHCQDLYEELLRTKVLMTARESPAAAHQMCLAVFAPTNDSNQDRGLNAEQICDIYVRHADDARQRVSLLIPILHHKTSMRDDPNFAAEVARGVAGETYFEGLVSPAVCQSKGRDFSSIPGIPSRQLCTAAYYYRAAYAQGNAELCGKSGICRALMNQPHACDVYNEGARNAFCANLYTSSAANKSEERLVKLTARVASIKAKADELSSSLGSGNRAGGRKQRLDSLKQKCALMERTLRDAADIRHDPDDFVQKEDYWERENP